MYRYVQKNEIKTAIRFCSDKMNQLKMDLLRQGFKTEVSLIGSGVKNLVTRNGDEGFDLDYNLEFNRNIKDLPKPDKIKRYVMNFLNELLKSINEECFKNCQDSTSAITSRFITKDKRIFSFDIGILARNNNGNYCRLIHDKKSDSDCYHWETIPKSKDIYKKYNVLKRDDFNQDIRKVYLDKKNMYLKRNDHNHCSFVIFKETINEIFSQHYK